MIFEITVCPRCEAETLPAGSFRARCPSCNCYFSKDDERPEDRGDYPRNWARVYQHRYPTPGKRVKVRTL